MKSVFDAIKIIFKSQKRIGLFLACTILLFFIFLMIPIRTIPGNTFRLQLILLGTKDYLTLSALSVLGGLILTMQLYLFRLKNSALGSAAVGGLGVFSGIFSSLFAAATCGLCVGALFSFLGAGTIVSIVNNRSYIILGSIGLLFLSLFLTARRFNTTCEACRIR